MADNLWDNIIAKMGDALENVEVVNFSDAEDDPSKENRTLVKVWLNDDDLAMLDYVLGIHRQAKGRAPSRSAAARVCIRAMAIYRGYEPRGSLNK